MRRLVIRPYPRLAAVLDALGSGVSTSQWTGRRLHYCSKDNQDISSLEQLGLGRAIPGTEFLNALPNLAIVIDGEFAATDAEGRPWVILNAVDTTWFEVTSADPAVYAAIKSRFEAVEEQSSDGPAA